MSNDAISVNKNNSVKIVKSLDEIKKMSNVNDKAKMFLNSVFKELDTQKDGILQKNEGAIYVFDDGAISVMKDDKLYAAMTKNGSETKAVGSFLVTQFNDGGESIMKNDKLIGGKTADNKEFTVKDGVISFIQTEKKEKKQATKDTTSQKAEVKSEKKEEVKAPKTAESKKSEKINGVEIEQLNKIAEEYLKIVYNIGAYTDYSKVVKAKNALYKKYSGVFKKAINSKIKLYNFQDLKTDKYIMRFSPRTNMETSKDYWELYDVEKIK